MWNRYLQASEPFGFLGGRRTRKAVFPFCFIVDNQMFNMFCRDAMHRVFTVGTEQPNGNTTRLQCLLM